jgi:hypothetical protein
LKRDIKEANPFADAKIIADVINEATEKIKASIAQAESKYPNLLENDYLLEKLADLFNGRIGSEYPPKRLEEIETNRKTLFASHLL